MIKAGVAWQKPSMFWDGDKEDIKNKRKVLRKAEN